MKKLHIFDPGVQLKNCQIWKSLKSCNFKSTNHYLFALMTRKARDVTRLWQKQAMPAPETALPALKIFKMRKNLWKVKSSKILLTKSAIQTIFFLRSSMLRRMEKGFSDHTFQKNIRLQQSALAPAWWHPGDSRLVKMPLRVSMAEAMLVRLRQLESFEESRIFPVFGSCACFS